MSLIRTLHLTLCNVISLVTQKHKLLIRESDLKLKKELILDNAAVFYLKPVSVKYSSHITISPHVKANACLFAGISLHSKWHKRRGEAHRIEKGDIIGQIRNRIDLADSEIVTRFDTCCRIWIRTLNLPLSSCYLRRVFVFVAPPYIQIHYPNFNSFHYPRNAATSVAFGRPGWLFNNALLRFFHSGIVLKMSCFIRSTLTLVVIIVLQLLMLSDVRLIF